MTTENQLYHQQEQNMDSQQLINVLTLFIGYTLLITAFIILGIVNGLAGAALIGLGGVLIFGIFRYNEVNQQQKRDEKQILIDELNELKEKVDENNTSNESSNTTQDSNEHSHGNYSHSHTDDFPQGLDTSNIITSNDSDNYGICEDGDPLYNKYLKNYNLLNHGSSSFNIPEDTAVKKIKVTFKPHVMNSDYDMNNSSQLDGMVSSGDPAATYPNNLPGIHSSVTENDNNKLFISDIKKGIVTLSQIQVIEQTIGKYTTDEGAADTDGLTNIAPGSTLVVSSGTTEAQINSSMRTELNGKHVNAKHMLDGNINTFYHGGLTKDTTLNDEVDGFTLTLAVAKKRNDIASIVFYTPIAGCMKHAKIELFNGNDKPLMAEPVQFPSGDHTIYEFKLGALGGSQFISQFLKEQNKVDLYYHVRESINSKISETRQEYAQSHFRANPNNTYTCEDFQEESSEGFMTRLNKIMFGPTETDVAKEYNVKPIANDLLK